MWPLVVLSTRPITDLFYQFTLLRDLDYKRGVTVPLQLNLMVAWLWILLGFISGMFLGMFFHREEWLGGYASLKRRMYRLGHISFFGLGAVNLFFWLTAKNLSASGTSLGLAAWAFVLGAVTMPLCCLLMAHVPKSHSLFAVPVLSLITGGVLMLVFLLNHTSTFLAP